jgi:flavin reductase (DIM6/NTAB) family NADH-FMN oxidoreductase RutF
MVTPDTFRRALGSWGSGVAIVTARLGDEVHGMTVSALSSVSLDPPLVLVCADKSSNTHALMQRSGCFAANILADDQEALALRFADKKQEATRFVGLPVDHGPTGSPLLPDAVASIDCVTLQSVDAGDHVIHVGRAEHVVVSERRPLLYLRSAFGAFRDSAGPGLAS